MGLPAGGEKARGSPVPFRTVWFAARTRRSFSSSSSFGRTSPSSVRSEVMDKNMGYEDQSFQPEDPGELTALTPC